MSDIGLDNVLWYYEDQGTRLGPVSENTIIQLIKSSSIPRSSLVWREGMADWAKIETTELLIHLDKQKTPPPLTGEHINNNLVWFLAFAPILGYFLEWFVAGFVSGATGSGDYATEMAMADAKYWYVTIILNIALSYADVLQLRKAGHNTDKFKGLVWLVPVYLYQRAQATKQNLAYFIVWIVSFILIISI